MCGRFTYAKEFRELRIRFHLDRDIPLFRPRYNIAPGQEVAVIFNRDGARGLAMMQWGLVAEKPACRRLIGKRVGVVPPDGFYEWRKEGKLRGPMRFRLKAGEPFG